MGAGERVILGVNVVILFRKDTYFYLNRTPPFMTRNKIAIEEYKIKYLGSRGGSLSPNRRFGS